MIVNYIKRQKTHHSGISSADEYRKFLEDNMQYFDESYISSDD